MSPLRAAAMAVVLFLLTPLGAPAAIAGPARATADRPTPGAPGIGDPYYPEDGNGGFDVTHYAVHDAYDLGSGRLHGHTVIEATATQALSRFDLDFLLPVSRVTVDGRPARFGRRGDHELVITPRHALPDGDTMRVRVDYAGRPASYRDHGRNWLADGQEVVAMNEPHMAAWWFPGNDHPRDKATYDIFLTEPRVLQVIANGDLVGRHGHGTTRTTHWRETDPMASYLAFFAAGHFEVRHGVDSSAPVPGGRPWYVAVSRRLPAGERRGDLHTVRQTPAIVDWLERVLGPYPFTSTGGLVTSLDPGFALENQTRPTYPAFDPTNVELLVHELTHQWFGDSVSVHDWRDIWVNEGFAQWMQTYWDETHGGKPAQKWLTDLYASYAQQRAFWRLRIENPGARDLFATAVYDRGAMAVQALRHRIGDPAFFTLLRTWVSQRHFGNGSVRQFEQLATQVSGQDLTRFFDVWLHRRRAPADTAANGLG